MHSNLRDGLLTGGANMDVDLDNLQTQLLAAPTNAVIRADLLQDFDCAGGSPYRTLNFGGPPPQIRVNGPSTNFLRLINDGIGNNINGVAFNNSSDTP